MLNKYTLLFSILSVTLLAACSDSDDDDLDSSGLDDDDQIVCSTSQASPLDESQTQDFSNDPDAPTQWELAPGSNVLSAATGAGDVDYVSFTVDTCDMLNSITLTAYEGSGDDNIGFVALDTGATFPFVADDPNREELSAELAGFSLFGTQNISEDILALISVQEDAIGFELPLGPGTYTLWLNQTGPESTYSLDFSVDRVLTDS